MFEDLIFTGKVRHRRLAPKAHQFSYQLFMFCFDIGDLPNSFQDIKQIAIEKWNWFSFRRKDYLSHPEIALDDYARQLIFSKFNTYPKGKIYLLTHLSCFGFCFNPISLYFIFDETNHQLDYLILEVTNTPWGERHNYLIKISARPAKDVYHFQFQKELHVSPFLAMNYEYQFHLKLTKHKISVHMENHMNGKKDMDVTLVLAASEQQAKQVFRHHPLMTYKLIAAIYWQALKLWMKGIPFHSHPKTDKRIQLNDQDES